MGQLGRPGKTESRPIESRILEITLISAQGLKPPPSAKLRKMNTYALVWIDPAVKLRTQLDRVGSENPTWNEKFAFRVDPVFLNSDTSAIKIEIYASGYIRDFLVGTVRFLLSSGLGSRAAMVGSRAAVMGTPAFSAVQIRRPSGRFHGVLNLAATVYESSEFGIMNGLNALCFRDLIDGGASDKENNLTRRRRRRMSMGGFERSNENLSSGGESCDFSCGDISDGSDSTTSSSSNANSELNVLKELNGVVREKKQNKDLSAKKGFGMGGSLCGLMLQRRMSLGPLDENFQVLAGMGGRNQ